MRFEESICLVSIGVIPLCPRSVKQSLERGQWTDALVKLRKARMIEKIF